MPRPQKGKPGLDRLARFGLHQIRGVLGRLQQRNLAGTLFGEPKQADAKRSRAGQELSTILSPHIYLSFRQISPDGRGVRPDTRNPRPPDLSLAYHERFSSASLL